MTASQTLLSQNMLDAIIRYKQANDGVSPSLAELAAEFNIAKSQVMELINRLIASKCLCKTPGKSRNLAVTGGRWQWLETKAIPDKRAGDVLRTVVAYKQANDGNAPSHREIAQALGLSYTGDIKGYMDDLTEAGYISAAYATNRHIRVVGGAWHCDKEALARANPDIYKQRPLLPPE
jgi:SOS-response transcriptional repressor LexA